MSTPSTRGSVKSAGRNEHPLVLWGVARLLPDDVNTDYIISSRRKRDAAGAAELVPYILEDLVPPLPRPLEPRDIIVAGRNFGCGSAMEIAAEVLKAAGIKALVARSVARTFYRNAVNLGIPVLELAPLQESSQDGDAATAVAEPEVQVSWCAEGDRLSVAFGLGVGAPGASVRNLTRNTLVHCLPPPAFAVELVRCGGLIPFYQQTRRIPRGIL